MIQKSKEMVRLPEIINDLAFHASQVLIESMNIDSASAENAGQAIADRMMRNWGGQSIYFPKGISGRASERDYQIYSECDGRNYAELAKKYNLTLQWIYKIVKRPTRKNSTSGVCCKRYRVWRIATSAIRRELRQAG